MTDVVADDAPRERGGLRRELRREAPWRAAIVVLGGAAIVYTFYKQVWPKPAYPYDVFPLVVAGWAVAGIAITLAFPALARRIGENLRRAELDDGA